MITIGGESGKDIIKILESNDLDIKINKNIENRIKKRKWFDFTFYIKNFKVYFQLEDTAKNYFIKNHKDLNIIQYEPLTGKLYDNIFLQTKQEIQSIILNPKFENKLDTLKLEKRLDDFYKILKYRINRRLLLIKELQKNKSN